MKITIAVLIFISNPVFSANEYFRSIASGNWDAITTWEMSTNSGTTWIAATLTPSSASNIISIRNSHTVAVTVNVSADQFTIDSGGTMSINPGVIFTLLNGAATDLTVNNTGTVSGSGIFQTQGNVLLNLRNGSAFLAALKVNTGTATVSDLTAPFEGKLYGPVTVDAGATLSSNTSSSYTLFIYGNITNNGTITGTGINNKIKFFGSSIVNSGSVTSPVFRFDSVSTVSGAGTYTGADIIVGRNGNVSLLNDVAFSHSSEFIVDTNGTLSANSQVLTLDDSDLEILSSGTVINSGTIRALDRVNIIPRNGSLFNADLKIASGSLTWVYNSINPNIANTYGNITVDSGGNLSTGNQPIYKLNVHSNLNNNGTISNVGILEFPGGTHSIQGTGVITAKTAVLSGGAVNLLSDHIFLSVDIMTGATLDVTNRKASFTATNPINQNGTFTTTNSTIEYNGTALQSISTANINYAKLRINNPAGTSLPANLTVNDSLTLVLGDLDMLTRVLTLSPTGFLTETPGNTVKGTTGYITTTRTLNAPTGLNVGGLGAVLTTTSSPGSTEIRRGHAIQTGLNGGTSIRRFYDIIPENNDGLDASITFNYDESELNGKPESSLKLFSSTNTVSSWLLEGGNPNPAANSIFISNLNSFSRLSSDTSSSASMILYYAMEGFYNPATNKLNMRDTVRAYLRNTSPPYGIVDSSIARLDSITLSVSFKFINAADGTYYIQTKHRNSVETWSRSGGEPYFVTNTLNYNFTTSASKAFGNNLTQVDASPVRFAAYSGDEDQDGSVNLTDVVKVYNNATAFVNGYVASDMNGDNVTDLTDIVITFNNAGLFVAKITP